MTNSLPRCIKSCLWSYDTNKLDVKRHKNTIIPQVLNYGNWQGIKWLRSIYKNEEIKQILQNPRRGIWFADVLNFWEQMFNIKIDPKVRKRAIMDVNPDFNYKLPNSAQKNTTQ